MNTTGLIAGFVTILIVVLIIAGLWIDNSSLRGDLAKVNADYTLVKSENADFKTAQDKSNASIQGYKTAVATAQAQVEAAEKRANAVNDAYTTLESTIQNTKVDKDDCKGAKQLLTKFARGAP